MTIDSENLLNSILESLERIEYIKPSDIPNIDLYMDQVTTFMDSKLRSTARNPCLLYTSISYAGYGFSHGEP